MGRYTKVDLNPVSGFKSIDRPSGALTPFGKLVRAVARTAHSETAVEVGDAYCPRKAGYMQLGRRLRRRGLGLRSSELPNGNRALWASTEVRGKPPKGVVTLKEDHRSLSPSEPKIPFEGQRSDHS